MKNWFDNCIDADERQRRGEFDDKFKAGYDTFRALPLGEARHISEHRTGFAPVMVTVTGRFGITYSGGPAKPIPTSETREMPPEYGWMAKPTPVEPLWSDFDIDGKPLFQTCRDYLDSARALISQARELAEQVHRDRKMTFPPSKM